ncbi:MAG: COG1361 S-layer family protein, partial [Halobacteriota archaeon]
MAAEKRRNLLVTIVAVLLVASIALPVSGQEYTRGEPEISAYAPENEVVPGTESTVQIQLQNDGSVDVGTQTDVVTTARGVTVEVDDEGPFDVKTDQTALGPIQDGAAVTTDLRLAVPDDLEAGTYDVSLNVRYSHTRSISPQTERVNERSRLQNLEVTIVVTDDARFSIEDVQSDLQAGMSGTSEIEFENVGNQPAFDARATITGGNGLRFGEGATDVFIGDLEPGDSATVEVDTTLENGALEGAVPVEAAFEFEDAAGVSREAPPIVSGFPTAPKPTVRIENVQTSLAVGQDGHIRGTIHNDGPTAVTDGVLVIDPASESISVSEPQIALPELESGGSAAFEYDATVSSDTAGGMRQAQFSVQYANGGPVSVETDPVAQRIPVDEKLSFSIATLEDTLAVGYSGTISGALRNDGPRSVSDAVLVIEPVSDSIA